jgi:predicted ATPase
LPDHIVHRPELLAHHFTEGGLARQALGYWLKAGQRAARHSANAEAISHLSRGLDLVSNLPAESERAACELDLLIALGPALIAAKGQAAPEVEATYAKARALCTEVNDRPRLFTAFRGLYIFHLVRGQLGTAIELGEKLLELAKLSRDPGDMVEAHRALCATWMYVGQPGRALSEGRKGLALYDPSAHGSHAYRYGVDPGVALGIYTGWASWFLGFPTAALKEAEEACTRALASGHPYTLAQALVFACYVHQSRRDPQRTMEGAESALSVTGEQGFPVWAALMTVLRGWSLAELGDGSGGLEELRRGLAAYRSTGAEVAETYLLSLLAEAEGAAGHTAEALTTLDHALLVVARGGVRCWEPELHRLKGQLLLQRERANGRAAEDSFRKAIEVAREQEAKSWELRAATSLARLWMEQGKRVQARDLLAPLYGWFTEGFDTADLKGAKALLDQLA